jgi:hypothetical protein
LPLNPESNHLRPAAIGCIQTKYSQEQLNLPTRGALMSDEFKSMLRRAYQDDYKMPNIMHFGTAAIQWCKKLSFTDRYVQFHCSIEIDLANFVSSSF